MVKASPLQFYKIQEAVVLNRQDGYEKNQAGEEKGGKHVCKGPGAGTN